MVEILNALVWPLVVLSVILLFRRHVVALLERVRAVEGPGDFKVSLDKKEVEEIIREGKDKQDSPEKIAARIVQTVDKRESRIIRALFDDQGRSIYNYQGSYYRDALDNLLTKGYVRKEGKGYALTDEGMQIAIDYLQSVINRRIGAGRGGASVNS